LVIYRYLDVEPKMPLEVTSGDIMRLPVAIVNSTKESLTGTLACSVSGPGLQLKQDVINFNMSPQERSRRLIEVVAEQVSTTKLTLVATCGDVKDTVTRETKIVPLGFPHKIAAGCS